MTYARFFSYIQAVQEGLLTRISMFYKPMDSRHIRVVVPIKALILREKSAWDQAMESVNYREDLEFTLACISGDCLYSRQ